MENVFLIVGLGNPGADYAKTRHNAGFLLVEKLAAQWRCDWSKERKFQARVSRAERGGRTILLAEPQTFMNLSGESVGALVRFYQLPLERILVVVDDADLPMGEIRLRPRRQGPGPSRAGIGDAACRSRSTRGCGRIGHKDAARQITGHVLGKFSADENALLDKVLERAAGQLECWLDAGIQKAMNQFNGTVEELKS